MMRTKLAKNFFLGIGVLAVLAMGYCFWAYLRLRALLVPALTEITPQIDQITIGIAFSFLIFAVYHLLLLALSLRRVAEQEKPLFFNSVFFTAVIFSGIFILSNVTLLNDLGKEYLYFDVSGEWNMLLVISAFQWAVMAVGLVLQMRMAPNPQLRLFDRARFGDDVVFVSLNQVGLVCAAAGLTTLALPYSLNVAERFRAGYLLAMAIIAAAPLVSIIVYWLLRNRKKKLQSLLDEKQFMDLSFGAFLAFCLISMVVIILLVLRGAQLVNLNDPMYLLGLFFSGFLLVFGTVLLRFRMD